MALDTLQTLTVPDLFENSYHHDFDPYEHYVAVERFEEAMARSYGWRPGTPYIRHQCGGYPRGVDLARTALAVSEGGPSGQSMLMCLSSDERIGFDPGFDATLVFSTDPEDLQQGRFEIYADLISD